MLGKRFGPSVALDAGIVTSVVPDAEVDSVARAAARALAAKPPESLRLPGFNNRQIAANAHQ